MKPFKNLLVTGIMAVFCCFIAKAQINYSNVFLYSAGDTLIYSNAFNGSASENLTNTQPAYEAALFGGIIDTNWVDALGVWDTNAWYANGDVGTAQGDSLVLPFTPQSNQVYVLQATITFSGNPVGWVGGGFSSYNTIQGTSSTSNERFSSGGVDWALITEGSENVQNFANGTQIGVTNGIFSSPLNTPHTLTVILDTTSNKWVNTAIMDGIPVLGSTYGGIYHWASNPTIKGAGLTQDSGTTPNNYVWDSFVLFADPLVVLQQPVSGNLNQGSGFTNTVVAAGTYPFHYQWFTNGVPLVNGGNISGATNTSLVINGVLPNNAGTNYYCVVTNVYGAVTSSPASLGVYSTPQFLSADPITYTNPMTLFGGTNIDGTNYLGSSPSFSVFAVGQQPVTYFWLTNGVAVGGAASASFTFTNCQFDGPTNFSCIASNSLGTATNTWMAQYIPTPTAPYPQQVIAYNPVAYWRLDETNYDVNQYNDGEICDDFMSGNNGIYTNTELYQPGYYVINNDVPITNDPTETSALFTSEDYDTGDYVYGLGTNVDFSAVSNAEFTVSIWVNGGVLYNTAEPVNSGILIKGYYGSEEFGLDDGAGGGDLRFFLRSAANTVYAASSGVQVGGSNAWFHLVGVCDESNQVATLYINGFRAAQVTIPLNSGLLHDGGLPISLAENLSPGNLDSGHQFYGALDDAAIFPYAMNAGQVAQLYQAAGGSTVTTVYPPPTNVTYMAGSTLTIPASAFGSVPIGYYWTNVTVGGTIASGSTDVLQTLNATLTIPNAPAGLSGDQLELVVTNAGFSTNLFVTLFSPPPAVTLGYTNSILFTNEFYGGTWNIAGQPLTAENMLVGGTNSVWVDALGTNDTGSLEANGVDASTLPDSWILPFTPEPGFVYTETASLTFSGPPGGWVGLGFAQNVPTNAADGYGRFSDGGTTPPDEGPNGYDWMILTEGSGNVQYFAGPGGTPAAGITNENGFFTPGTGTHTAQIVLDTTGAQWVQYAFVDGVPTGTNIYTSKPPIGAVGITQDPLTAPGDVQWNYFALSAVSPNGFPPYLLAPLPSTNSILLTNSTVTISASGIGTGPWGYYWINNSTILASGTTNNTAPLGANLSIPTSSLSAGQLELALTNAVGTNLTFITLVSPVNANPTNIVATVTNNTLYLTWPVDHTGWQLQAQTNSLGVGISTNWVDYNPSTGLSTATNQVAIPINLTNGTVFYRLIYNSVIQ